MFYAEFVGSELTPGRAATWPVARAGLRRRRRRARPRPAALLALGAAVAAGRRRATEPRRGRRWSQPARAGSGPARPTLPDGVDLVVTSPGWRPDHPLLVARRRARRPGLGRGRAGLAAARRRTPAPWLAVTGTNGKTTTVQMLEAILRAAGLRARRRGNVGVPLVEAVLPTRPLRRAGRRAVQLPAALVAPVDARRAPARCSTSRPTTSTGTARSTAYARGQGAGLARRRSRVYNADDPLVARLLATARRRARVGFTLGTRGPGSSACVDGVLVSTAPSSTTPTGAELAAVADVRPAGAAQRRQRAGRRRPGPRVRRRRRRRSRRAARLSSPTRTATSRSATRDGVAWVDDSKATNPHAARGLAARLRPGRVDRRRPAQGRRRRRPGRRRAPAGCAAWCCSASTARSIARGACATRAGCPRDRGRQHTTMEP